MANGITGLAGLQRSEFPVSRTDGPGSISKPGRPERSSGPDFADAFAEAISSASSDEKIATDMSVKFADGDPDVGIHEVIIASEKANLSLRYTVTLKNKLLEAYRELMSTQV